jgi:hypothetical protein
MLGKRITLTGRLSPESVFIDGQGVRCGILCSGAEVGPETVIAKFTITDCSAVHGGGLHVSASPTIANCIIINNEASGSGGGIWNPSGSPSITECTFSGNTAGNSGGGIWTLSDSPPMLTRTILCNNAPNQINGAWIDGGNNCLVFECTDSNGDGWPDKCGQISDGVHHVPAEYPTIAAAIAAAGYGDEIVIAPGTYTGTGDAVIDPAGKQLWIHSSGGAGVTIINGENLRRCVQCINGESSATRIEGLALALGYHADNGGGIYCFDSWPTFIDCTVAWCATDGFGAGAYFSIYDLDADRAPVISGCLIGSNVSSNGGGGIYIGSFGNEVVIEDTTLCNNIPDAINGNWQNAGGNCIAFECSDSNGDGIPDKCFSVGDGVHEVPSEYSTIQEAIQAAGDGDTVLVAPGIYTGTGTDPIINPIGKRITILASGAVHDTIIDGENLRQGLWCSSGEDATTTIEGFTFDHCGAPGAIAAGTVLFANSSPKLVNCIVRNTAATYGGGVYFSHSQASLIGCEFAYATGVLGGALCAYQSDITVMDTTFAGCDAEYGAAIALFGESTAIFTSCISGFNQAYEAGGMAYLAAQSEATFIDCLVGLSIAPVGPGIMAATGASITFQGENQCAGTWCGDPGSTMHLLTDAICNVDDDVTTSPQGATTFDLDNLSLTSRLTVDGVLLRQGSLGITNNSASLVAAAGGDLYPLMQANTLMGSFSSIVLPVMPAGLGLQVVESAAARGDGGTVISLEVIEVEDIDLDDPFAENLDSPPLDMVNLDIDGDGADELAVLFTGTPGTVAIYDITENAPPVLIPELTTTAGNDPVDMDAGDLDLNGLDDLIIATRDDGTLHILLTELDTEGLPIFTPVEVDVPGFGQTLTCTAVIDWDGDEKLDAVVGADRDNPAVEDAWQVILAVGFETTTTGPLLNIPMYEFMPEGGSTVYLSDAPTCVTGGGEIGDAWGFFGGTNHGKLQYGMYAFSDPIDVASTGGNSVSCIEALDMDEDGGDGQLDILAASKDGQSVYLIPGDVALPEGFDDMIPIAVSEPVEDIAAIDADDDGDIDLVLASPTSTDEALLLLRNDPPPVGLLQALSSRVWSKNPMNNSSPITMTSGALNNKDDDDDWVIGGGEGDGLRGSGVGEIEQTNMFPAAIPGDTCASAVTARLGANGFDTSVLSDSGFGDPDEADCPGTYLDWNNSPDAWFTWTATADGAVSFSTCDTASYDTSMVLYTGATCDAIDQIGCNGDAATDSNCQGYYSALLDVPVTNGETLYVRIGGWNAATGTGTLTIDVAEGCPEDIDGNGTVNIDDLLLVIGDFGGNGPADVDSNGVVDIDDLLLVISAFGSAC